MDKKDMGCVCVCVCMCVYIYIYIYTHTCNRISLSPKKEWNLPICDNINRPRKYYAKQNKLETERWITYDFTYFWNFKNETYKQKWQKQEETHLQKGRGLGGWVK